MEAGRMEQAPDFSMQAMYDGAYCGACHDGDMAFASNEDCTSCHTKSGGVILYTEPVKSVIFAHESHDDFGCESCHEGLFKMEALAAQKNDDFTMESLYQGNYCGACHDGDTAFASDTQCATCHIGVKGYNRMTGKETKSH
jgi:c(7)-type cytochrome triheme protein